MQRFRSLDYIVSGEDITKYEWYHNGTLVPPYTNVGGEVQLVGRESSLLVFNPKLKQQGVYQLKITSKWGRIFGREIKVSYTSKY